MKFNLQKEVNYFYVFGEERVRETATAAYMAVLQYYRKCLLNIFVTKPKKMLSSC